jgi:hypothetical protein
MLDERTFKDILHGVDINGFAKDISIKDIDIVSYDVYKIADNIFACILSNERIYENLLSFKSDLFDRMGLIFSIDTNSFYELMNRPKDLCELFNVYEFADRLYDLYIFPDLYVYRKATFVSNIYEYARLIYDCEYMKYPETIEDKHLVDCVDRAVLSDMAITKYLLLFLIGNNYV